MASHPVGDSIHHQHWDEVLNRLLSLSRSTLRRNSDLEARVAELELELSVWKQAHAVALEASERETKAHNVRIATFNRQISSLDCFRGSQHPLILCALNGDETPFSPELLVQGQQGGRAAGQILTKVIASHLHNEDVQFSGRLSFWATLFLTKADLIERAVTHSICTREQLEGFLVGFSQSSPRFLVVDVGSGRDVDLKIKEYLQTYTYLPQTLRVFYTGPVDSGYMSTFGFLESERLLGKVVLLQNSIDPDVDCPLPALSRLQVEGLFANQILPYLPRKLCPSTVGLLNVMMVNGGLTAPQSPARLGGRAIDPSLPLHKQNPPPCNEHYLMKCSKGPAVCKYSHEYVLTPEQLVALASNAKKAPCNWLKNGIPCPFGDGCCWGHVCPNGPKCFHLSKGKCWFKGEAMHTIPSGQSSPAPQP